MAQKPNVLIISTHDSGRHFGCYGVPTAQTPAIDRLAAEGIKFTNMFGTCPICSPSRGALLSGQYPLTNGLVGLTGGQWQWNFHNPTVHLSHRLQNQGYYTAMFGFQHETTAIEDLGFTDNACHGIKGPGKTGGKRSATEVAEDAVDFLQHCQDEQQPFYAQVGFFETHTPYTAAQCPPDEDKGAWVPPYALAHEWPPWSQIAKRFDGDRGSAPQHAAELQGALRTVDNAVSMIMDTLKEQGLENNTLVLFTTDHGPEFPGAKWTMYDPGVGIAFIMRWPGGGIAGGHECDCLLSNVDFLPTLYDLLDLEKPGDLEGKSFAEVCRNPQENKVSPREIVFGNWIDGLNFSARTERYKLIRNLVPVDSTGRECPPYELYDLYLDPLELMNVVDEPVYSDVFHTMRNALNQWLKDMNDPVADEELPIQEHEQMIAEYRRRYEKLHG